MEVDSSQNNLQESEAVGHVQLFMTLIAEECKDMIADSKPLDQTSKKIKSLCKVLPQLINADDQEALELVVHLISEHLVLEKIEQVSSNQQNSETNEVFTTKFYLERIIEIMESIPVHKNFIKDAICKLPTVAQFFASIANENAQFIQPEVERKQDFDQNILILRIVKSMVLNHADSQKLLNQNGLVNNLYVLSMQTKFKPMTIVLLSEDIVKLLTNDFADKEVKEFLTKLIETKRKE